MLHNARSLVFVRLLPILVLVGASVTQLQSAAAAPLRRMTVTACANDQQLQADIAQANTDHISTRITFRCPARSTVIPITTGTLQISGQVIIDGGGYVTLDGGHHMASGVMIFFVTSSGYLTIERLTIQHGFATGSGGAILNAGTLAILDSQVSANDAVDNGGAIANAGTLSITASTLDGNTADNGNGGAIDNVAGTTTITASTLSNGSADNGYGGGVYNDTPGTLVITASTLMGNHADGDAGGGVYNAGTFHLLSSTLSGNHANGGSGGGIYTTGSTTLTNSTLNGNTASTFAGIQEASGSVAVAASIVAGNTGGDCSSAITDSGDNLDGDGSCGFTTTAAASAVFSAQGLAKYGGPTATIALLSTANNPALTGVPANLCPPLDQRGYFKPFTATTCAIGAYQPKYIATLRAWLADFVRAVRQVHAQGTTRSHLDQLAHAIQKDVLSGRATVALRDITTFSGYVQGQSGNQLTAEAAQTLVTYAQTLREVIG